MSGKDEFLLLWAILVTSEILNTFDSLVLSLLTLLRYEESKTKGTDNYDRDLEDVIDRLILECDRKIDRALKRLDDDDAKAAIAISVSEVTQVTE